MSDDNLHWWQKIWTPAALATTLLVGSLLVMGLIVLLASWIESWGKAPPSASPPVATTSARSEGTRSEESMPSYATQRPPADTGGFSWPSSPSRRGPRAAGGSGGGTAGSGLSAEKYQEALESGKKVYLPNPSGECNLGAGEPLSAQALDGCFSKQAKAK